jgi:hypothetical protein
MILFLDFDGVLHPDRASVDELFCRIGLLQDWLRVRPGVDVVISSSWREVHPIDELRSFFAEDLQARIVGVTPNLKVGDWAQVDGEFPPARFGRQLEVLQWLRTSSKPWRPWAALDDQAWMFRPLELRLVVCDSAVGLTVEDLAAVDKVMGESG